MIALLQAVYQTAGGPLPAGLTPGIAPLGGTTCLTGTIQRIGMGIPFRGTHLLSDGGRMLASLFSNTLNLDQYVGQRVTVCGVAGTPVEGITPLNVTSVSPPGAAPYPVVQPGYTVVCLLVPAGYSFAAWPAGALAAPWGMPYLGWW